MQAFEYARPSTVAQAVKLLAAPGAMPLGGGADLLGLMKDHIEAPRRLVALKGIAALREVRSDAGGLHIGALVTVDELSHHADVKRDYKVVADAAGHVAGPQIRNVATVGGNLCQRPRCWYYRNGFGLLPERDGRSMVLEGDNRYHAILGNQGPALFVHPSTLAPVLIALGARVRLAGGAAAAEREMDLAELYRTPHKEGESEHRLGHGELVTGVVVPPPPAPGDGSQRLAASYEVRQRQTLDWSLATAAVVLLVRGGKVAAARIVLGQVAPEPWRAQAAEALLLGKAVDAALAAQVGVAAVQGAHALSQNQYKIQLAQVAVKRALLSATGQKEA